MSNRKTSTFVYFAVFIALGAAGSALGPTLQELAKNTHSTLNQISILFTARSFGYLLGSLQLGRAFDRLPGHSLLAVVLISMSAALGLTPLVSQLWLLVLILLFLGISEGAVDVGTNLLLVWQHRENLSPLLNALHFFFGLGSVIGPFIIGQVILLTGGISWAYWILAVYPLFFVIWLFRLPSPEIPSTKETRSKNPVPTSLILIIVLFFYLYVGAEVSFGGWISTYAVKTGVENSVSAAYLTAIFWGALTVGRLLSIPFSNRFRPIRILSADLAGCLISISILLIFPGSRFAIWGGAIGLGLSMASMFPTMLAYAERRMRLSGQITRWFFVGSALGGMTLPWLIGQLFGPAGPQAAMFVILVDLLAVGIVLGLSRAYKPDALPDPV